MSEVKKTIMLCDGFEVSFSRRKWSEANETILTQMDEIQKIESSGMTDAEKQSATFKLDMKIRENVLSRYVDDWDGILPRLSVAGFNQLEKAFYEFSKQELVEGNS
ncbi:MAG: hypothetical protein ACI4P0_03990 [Mailhella sp.]